MKFSAVLVAIVASAVAVSGSPLKAGASASAAITFNRAANTHALGGLTCQTVNIPSFLAGLGSSIGAGMFLGGTTGASLPPVSSGGPTSAYPGSGKATSPIDLPSIVAGLRGSVAQACLPLINGNQAAITGTVIAKVQADIVAAVKTAQSQCNSFTATGKATLSFADSIALSAEISTLFQTLAGGLSKVTCTCVADELNIALGAIDTALGSLVSVVMGFSGSLKVNIFANIAGLAGETGTIDAFKVYGLQKTLKACGN